MSSRKGMRELLLRLLQSNVPTRETRYLIHMGF
jgi:hypothetical protein